MWLKYLELKNFRNFSFKNFNFNNKKNIISGKNGAGKTSILEAIFIFSSGKSFRSSDFFIPNYISDTYYIKGEFVKTESISHTIEISYSKTDKRKKIKKDLSFINNFSDIIGTIKTVLFIQKDLSIIEGSPEIKRKFLNYLFSQIDKEYYLNLVKYNKILESRNFVLKQEDDSQKFKNIEILNSPLIEYGSNIIFKRSQYISALGRILSDEMKNINVTDVKCAKMKYINNVIDKTDRISLDEIKNNYIKKIEKNLQKEIIAGYSIFGPHRDNLIFESPQGYDLKEILSAGEKRIVALALKFSEFHFIKNRTDEQPIILMDDILVELDKENRYIFIDFINKLDVQFFITSINLNDYKEIKEKEVINLNGKSR